MVATIIPDQGPAKTLLNLVPVQNEFDSIEFVSKFYREHPGAPVCFYLADNKLPQGLYTVVMSVRLPQKKETVTLRIAQYDVDNNQSTLTLFMELLANSTDGDLAKMSESEYKQFMSSIIVEAFNVLPHKM